MADTIAALATGGALSAIGIIRISGDDAIKIASAVFRAKNGTSMENAENRKLYYGYLTDKDGNDIDICLCTISRAPHSYTGENTAEFQCHGSPTVLTEGLNAVFAAGARQAEAGEFTKRAFLNGRMDLTQAEAVADLIEAETPAAARNAVGHLDRAISSKTDGIYSKLLDVVAHFNVEIDYPDDDTDPFVMEDYRKLMADSADELKGLYETYGRGKILKDGMRCAIIGKPNVGKSSLLNAILGYDRAIVTDIAGTTRDTIEERVRLGDVILRLTDTAGIRETGDPVEKIGVDRAVTAADEAEFVIAVFDGSAPPGEEDAVILEKALAAPKAVAVMNKSDMGYAPGNDSIMEAGLHCHAVSAITGEGISGLCSYIESECTDKTAFQVGELVTNARQADAIRRAADALDEAVSAHDSGLTPDCVLTAVEQALSALGEISGRTFREDMIGRIFERFCVGK